MNEATVPQASSTLFEAARNAALRASEPCEECLGSGGWYRYEPALDPAPGLLYLSCMRCRGSGRTDRARD